MLELHDFLKLWADHCGGDYTQQLWRLIVKAACDLLWLHSKSQTRCDALPVCVSRGRNTIYSPGGEKQSKLVHFSETTSNTGMKVVLIFASWRNLVLHRESSPRSPLRWSQSQGSVGNRTGGIRSIDNRNTLPSQGLGSVYIL